MSHTRTNEEWLYALNANGELQEAAIVDLRDLLLRATLYFFSRNLDDLSGIDRDEIMQRAEDCAQESLLAVLNHLADFRGDSKFTTWAYKFAINIALMTSRRERWKGKSLDQLRFQHGSTLFEWERQGIASGVAPDRFAILDEVCDILRETIERDLTEKQRYVLIMMVFNEVPMDEMVLRLSTNRNAIYKMLHDARRKLKNSLQARGFEVSEMLALFSEPG
jgi:RNA polymerase sigma-70 factor (ECF subfamily)